MEYAIETFSLTKVFSDWWGRNKVSAVDDLNLQINYNEIFGLLGPNGSGKTTTLKMILGLLYPTKGRTLVLGGDCTAKAISSRIGFMPEESYLYKYLSARETLDFYGRLFGLPPKIRSLRTEALLDMVGLKAVANRAVGTFSKGMARRIGLAQALINDPDLLILDEPTTGLDPIGTRQIKDLIIALAKRGKTVLLCTHLLADVEDVCDRIAILYGGKIQSEGKVRELLQQTDKRQITTSAISDAAVERIKQIVQNEHADCAVSSPMDRLETFFIRIVTEAQQQAQPTSGAVSTTQIGDFLTAASTEKSGREILDKLVATPVSTQAELSNQDTASVQKAVSQTVEVKPDHGLLSKLTKVRERVTPIETEPVKPAVVKEEETQVKKNILDQLAGRSGLDNDNRQTENQDGESTDG